VDGHTASAGPTGSRPEPVRKATNGHSTDLDATGEGVVIIEERDDGQVREVAHVVGESVGGSKIGLPAVRRCVSGTLEPMLLSAIREA